MRMYEYTSRYIVLCFSEFNVCSHFTSFNLLYIEIVLNIFKHGQTFFNLKTSDIELIVNYLYLKVPTLRLYRKKARVVRHYGGWVKIVSQDTRTNVHSTTMVIKILNAYTEKTKNFEIDRYDIDI